MVLALKTSSYWPTAWKTSYQAIAMVDKYFTANPEKWDLPMGNGIVLALTVKNGPCAGIDP